MADDLKKLLFGKTVKIKLADKNEYVMREPDIEALETVQFDTGNMADLKNVKKLAWIMLKEDNVTLTEENIGKMITASMLKEGSHFLDAISALMGSGDTKNEPGAAI